MVWPDAVDQVLHIDLASFKIGGELILLQFGISMLKETAMEVVDESGDAADDLKQRVLLRCQSSLS